MSLLSTSKIYLGDKLICSGENTNLPIQGDNKPIYINKEGQLYRQIFYDDFDKGDIDHNYWREDYMPSRVETSYNAYSDVRCEDSCLILRCKKGMGGRDGTENGATLAVSSIQSAVWNGMHLSNPTFHDFRPWYGLMAQEGLFKCRAKVVSGSGIHCAFWLIGTENTSRGLTETCEIDAFEIRGNYITQVPFNQYQNGDSTVTTKSTTIECDVDLSEDFHEYAFEWNNGEYKIYIDNELKSSLTLNTPQYPLILFLSVYRRQSGTGWTGDADNTLPDTEFYVDYLKIYKKATTMQNNEITITSIDEINISFDAGNYTVNNNTGFLTSMPIYCYINWNDGSRTEHWVKWDRFDNTKKDILDNGGTLEWEGVVYGIGTKIKATITATVI